MKAYHVLTDSELEEQRREGGDERLAAHYRALRDHYIAETTHFAARDRSAILRMAGNIAAGLVEYGIANNTGDLWSNVAKNAVEIAREIIAEVDAEIIVE